MKFFGLGATSASQKHIDWRLQKEFWSYSLSISLSISSLCYNSSNLAYLWRNTPLMLIHCYILIRLFASLVFIPRLKILPKNSYKDLIHFFIVPTPSLNYVLNHQFLHYSAWFFSQWTHPKWYKLISYNVLNYLGSHLHSLLNSILYSFVVSYFLNE